MMIHKFGRVLSCLVILFLLSSSGCSDSPHHSGKVLELEQVDYVTPAVLLENAPQSMRVGGEYFTHLDADVNGQSAQGILEDIWKYIKDNLEKFVRYPMNSYKVTYVSTDAHGREQVLTGLLVVPVEPRGTALTLPILSLQHPTQVERRYSPSKVNILDNELTTLAALLLASTGYIVVAADYPGLGDNPDVHPYCHTSLANSVIDMITAGLNSREQWKELINTSWNGDLYLMGYSEGGYATMVTARALQKDQTYSVNAVAALDGPYSLSDTMRDVMIRDNPKFSAPYFLPYVIAGYDAIYKNTHPNFDYDFAIKQNIPNYTPPEGSSFARELYRRMDGHHTPAQINELIYRVSPYTGPNSILTEAFIRLLEDTSSDVFQTLEKNNAYNGWVPQMPMKLFHNALDDLVPAGNLERARAHFPDLPNLEYELFDDYIRGLGSVHAGALPVAYVKGFLYLDRVAFPERHKP